MSEQTARLKPVTSSWLSTLLRLLGLLVLLGVGAAGYVFLWPQVEAYQAKQARVEQSLASLSKADEAIANELTALIDSKVKKSEDATLAALQSAMTRLSDERDAIRDIEQRAAGKLNEAHHLLYRMSKTDQRAWQRAEAAFNIRLASQRVQFAGDVSGALRLLSQADALLQSNPDDEASTIRSAIAFDRAQLRVSEKLDLVGLMGRLSALDRQIKTLNLTTFDPLMNDTNEDASELSSGMDLSQTVWEEALNILAAYFVITELESPEQKPEVSARFAILSMTLNVEQARVALLARDSKSFSDALLRAAEMLAAMPLSNDDPTVGSLIEELTDLSTLSLGLSLPELETLKLINKLTGSDTKANYLGSRPVVTSSLIARPDIASDGPTALQQAADHAVDDNTAPISNALSNVNAGSQPRTRTPE